MTTEKKLMPDALLDLYFESQYCDPKDKVEKEKIWLAALDAAVEQTGTPLYVLKPALLKTYPQYRAKRLGKEMPDLPFENRIK